MNNRFQYLLLLILFSFTACDKDAIFADADLEGSWELRHISGIQIATLSPDFPPGNGHIVRFEGNTYQIYDKGKLLLSSTFKIVNDKQEIDGTEYSSKLVYQDSGHERPSYIKISGDKLKICSGTRAADGTTATYKKQ